MRFSGSIMNEGKHWLAAFSALRVFCRVPVDAGPEALATAVRTEFVEQFSFHRMLAPEFSVSPPEGRFIAVTFQGDAVDEAVRFALIRARIADLRNLRQAAKGLNKKSSGYVKAYESGLRHPSARTLDALLRVYGAELSIVSSRPDPA